MRKRKRSSFTDILIAFLALVLMLSFASGALQDIFEDESSGGGSVSNDSATVPKPSDCAHLFRLGTCEKCGQICSHRNSEKAEDGMEYCTACGLISALDPPVLRNDSNVISWDLVPFAESYDIYVNGQYFASVANSFFVFNPDYSGVYDVTVKASAGNVSSAHSNALQFTFYGIQFNEENHAYVYSYEHNGLAYPVVAEGHSFFGYVAPLTGYLLPQEVSVIMDGVLLDPAEYSYDNTTGELTIGNITGEVFVDYRARAISVPELSLNGSVISWNAIQEAKDYHIRVWGYTFDYDEYYETAETSFDLESLNLIPGPYYIFVWVDTGDDWGGQSRMELTIGENGAPMKLGTPFIYFM